MSDREKVMRGLEHCAASHKSLAQCKDCVYYAHMAPPCIAALAEDALDLLKEQEPRVMTLDELIALPAAWQPNTPPYLCVDEKEVYIKPYWVSWSSIYGAIRYDGTMGKNNYGKTWRLWTACPTNEQRKAVKWDE